MCVSKYCNLSYGRVSSKVFFFLNCSSCRCFGIYCNSLIYFLFFSWIFGEFMCKMYHFINSLSTTASVLILVVICIERYLAIIHPMTCKQMLTLNRLRVSTYYYAFIFCSFSMFIEERMQSKCNLKICLGMHYVWGIKKKLA